MCLVGESFEFSFCGRKTRFTHAIAANKRATTQLQNKKIEFTYNYFPRRLLWTEVNLRTWIIIDDSELYFPSDHWLFLKKTLSLQSSKLVSLFFNSEHMLFFSFTRSLIDRCQIVTDTCKNNVTKFVRKPFKSPLSLRKLKCFSKAFLFNLHHPYFNYHLLVQKLFSLWKILPYLQPLIIRVLSEELR